MRRVIGCAVTVIVILSLLISGISCSSKPEETAQISNLHTFMQNESYGVGDGYISGSISNTTNKVRDYKINVQRWAPQLGFGSNTESEYQETVGTVMVLQVQPGEQKSWECLLFTQRGSKNMNWEWRVCVDGWCWKHNR